MSSIALTHRQSEMLYQIDEELKDIEYVIDPVRARQILAEIRDADEPAALDFETTGLDPREGAVVRLSCIHAPCVGTVLIDHQLGRSFADMVHAFDDIMWIVYNAKFEWMFFDFYGLPNVSMMDVDFMAKAVRGGGHSSLSVMARRDLGVVLDKDQQLSNWADPALTELQLKYAGKDALVTYKLFVHWRGKMERQDVPMSAAYVFMDAVGATVECEKTGMTLDVDLHQRNVDTWNMKHDLTFRRLRRFTPKKVLDNPGSDMQVAKLLERQLPENILDKWPRTDKKGTLSLRRPLVAPIAAKSSYPFSRWLNALLRYRYYRKYLSTYGEKLITIQYMSDGVFYRLNIGAAATGRYSSSSINIQNIPRKVWVRRAFLPPKGYDHLIVADYSSIEVRVLAEISGDKRLLADVIYGDVHSSSASAIYDIPEDEFLDVINDEKNHLYSAYKEMRSKAKAFTFQLCYGAAAPALSVALRCTVSEAEEAIRAWSKRYQKAYGYRYQIFDNLTSSGYIPVHDGRKIFVPKPDRTMPIASNYGIQGAAGSVMLRAMHHVKVNRDAVTTRNRIAMCATVHDELLLAAMDTYEPVAKDVLERGMVQGWLDIFPDTDTHGLVEAGIGPNWGDSK